MLCNNIKNEKLVTRRIHCFTLTHAFNFLAPRHTCCYTVLFHLSRSATVGALLHHTTLAPHTQPNHRRSPHHIAGLRHTVSSTPYLQHSHMRHAWSVTRHTTLPLLVVKLKVEMPREYGLELIEAVVAAAAHEQRRGLQAADNNRGDIVHGSVSNLQNKTQNGFQSLRELHKHSHASTIATLSTRPQS